MRGATQHYGRPSEQVQNEMDRYIIDNRNAGFFTVPLVVLLFHVDAAQARSEMQRFNARHEDDTRITPDGILHVRESIYDGKDDRDRYLKEKKDREEAARKRANERRAWA